MERVWLFESLAVCVARIDFVDPAHRGEPDVRERGVRIEVRPFAATQQGSAYASDPTTLEPALCRFDLLESRPGAADRMHWHPGMRDGEPHERVFDKALSADPLGWVSGRLGDVGELVGDAAAADVASVRTATEEIVAEVARGLDWSRSPWPETEHDERGLARG